MHLCMCGCRMNIMSVQEHFSTTIDKKRLEICELQHINVVIDFAHAIITVMHTKCNTDSRFNFEIRARLHF